MKRRFPLLACTVAAVLLPSPAALAQGCDALWLERNSIYKEAGYCFRTARAVARFGNAGCAYDSEADVPLSARQRQVIAEIKRTETRLGCR